jgi:hypothetical protein
MLNENIVERRLLTLEQAVSELQSKFEEKSSENWLEKMIGSISDEEAFLEALEYGRSFRKSDMLTDEGSK